MPYLSFLLAVLDSRSFTSLWYWLVLGIVWMITTRHLLGLPRDVVYRARHKGADATAADNLLGWLAMVLPRWQMGQREGMVLTLVICFVLAVVATLGFGYGLEVAQAVTILLVPLTLILAMRVRLARQLAAMLHDGQMAGQPATDLARRAADRLIRHGWLAYILWLICLLTATFLTVLWMMRRLMGY